MNLEKIFKKLDLDEYLSKFNSFLAREKELFLEGDSRVNFAWINEISKFNISSCKSVENLDDAIMRISKQAVLHISEIYEFVKIINYFTYLKKFNFSGNLGDWMAKIQIPAEILEILNFFDKDGNLKDEIDGRFFELKQSLKFKKDEINLELKRLIYSKQISPYLVDTQIHYINENETLLVRGGFNHVLKGSVVGRSSGGYFYVEPNSISKLKSDQSAILDSIEMIIYEHCKKISKIFNKNLLFLKFINKAFDKIDSIIARVLFAKSRDFEFIISDNSNDIIIKDFAHPALKNPKRVSVNFTKKALLITGVNAGGKSMLLKSILSVSLLAKYLLPVSINSTQSKIGSFKEFEIIMEDPQNSKNDISTFAGRMISFSKIFGKKNMLLGVDEIELGTDFEEAASLYSVMIKQLIENGVKMVITTHHKRLAMLLAKNSDVELVAALYDEKFRVPKFEFLEGMIGKSYAFETALRYGISANLVSQAKQIYGEDKQNLNEIINKTINLELDLKEKLTETKKKEEKLDHLLNLLKNQKQENDKIQKELISKLEFEYYKAINEAKRGINLNDIKDKQRSINKANDILNSIKKPVFKEESEPLKVGDRAKYNQIKGEIIEISSKNATIISDGIRLKVPLNLLKKIQNQSNNKKSDIKISVTKPKMASVVLDLHGLRSEEALQKLDKFISDSLLMGFDEVMVKHGIGSGRLAFAVREFLKSHPSVKEFRDGVPNEGGFGTKVIKF
ncbi:endonuclease MutS2 [Campylobacter sp. FMV-PI01]|uniref:Endonuclease MutS2 n=1 Tax=Campylobacter portucalensis TaxID=2608384 RepID=A0A6L5WHX9_9BACT|nr:endonuclease MutS2 [Campylobacter portucalensis]MSN96516.1 endonuclease MutS2 [Campylobacter portucalensis]